ncbi:retrovirus-related pol polyprotein from transposon TNT 1-94, partial [Tanacetum coccineum]
TIFNANKEIILIAPRRNNVHVLDMSSPSPNGACFFAKASESVNWLWHKRLSHLNFKNINKLSKQNKVLGLPSLVYSKDKPCTTDITYYVIPHGRSLSELTQENQVPEVIGLNEPDIPHTKDTKGHPDLINTEGTHEQNVQNDQMITQPTDVPSGNNTEDRWSRDQHIELVNIIGDLGEGMLTRSMAAKLTAALASECLFADFLSEIEPKKVSEALKHPGWVDSMQEELN